MEEDQKKPIDNESNASIPAAKEDPPAVKLDNPQSSPEPNADTEPSSSPKKQKVYNNNPTPKHYQDTSFNEKATGYCSFSATHKKPESTQSDPVQKLLNQTSTLPTNQDLEEEDEQQKKIAAAKKLLFPAALATSFSEVADTLRSERRQEFCPIYKDETPEQIIARQEKQKPVGSLLSKRIRWDDLKRKREDEEKKAQTQFRYGPYGPIYTSQQVQQQSFANPYEQYYATMQNQYEQMMQMSRTQQEHSGFWPEYLQQPTLQNNDIIAQNSIHQQMQPYSYPYSAMYANNLTGTNASVTSADYNSYLNIMQQPPPPPPPDEPYPS